MNTSSLIAFLCIQCFAHMQQTHTIITIHTYACQCYIIKPEVVECIIYIIVFAAWLNVGCLVYYYFFFCTSKCLPVNTNTCGTHIYFVLWPSIALNRPHRTVCGHASIQCLSCSRSSSLTFCSYHGEYDHRHQRNIFLSFFFHCTR